MLFTNLYETTGHQGHDNLRRLLNAIKHSQEAELIIGNEPVTLTYPEARFLGGQYRAFQKAGRVDEFLRHLVDPVWFDTHMAKLRGMIDRQRALGEMEIDVNPNDLQSDVEREQETQRMTQQDAAAGGLAEDDTVTSFRGPHGRLTVDRSNKGVTKVTRRGWHTDEPERDKQTGRGRPVGSTGYTPGVGVGQRTDFSKVPTERGAGRMQPRIDYDDDRINEAAGVVQFSDFDTWRDRISDLGGEIHVQKNRTSYVATNWSGEELGQFDTRSNQGWAASEGVAEGSESSNKVVINGKVIGHLKTDEDGDPVGVVYDRNNRPYEIYGYNDIDQLKREMVSVYTQRVRTGVAEGSKKTKPKKPMTWQQAYAHNDGESFDARQKRITQYEKSKGEKKPKHVDWGKKGGMQEGVAEGKDTTPPGSYAWKLGYRAGMKDTTNTKPVGSYAYKLGWQAAKKKKEPGVAEGSEDLVQIEYWQQETMESGRWVKTKPIPRATAEKIVNSFERGEIVDVEQGVAEAGPFSYGAKKPKKGSVADLAAKKRQEQERGKQPIEPRDQRVGVAKVSPKDVAEEKHGLYYNVNRRKKAGISRDKDDPRAPTAQAWRDAAKTAKKESVEEDWQKANKQDKTDGMSQKAVNAYRRENPGSKLKTAVTTKPSKLKKGSKASKRRSSYCSRSAGQKKMHHIDCSKTPDKAICKARRRWNCEESVMEGRVKEIAIQYQDYKHLPEMAFQSRYKISKREWWAKYGTMVQGSGLGIGLNEFAPGDGSDRSMDWTQLVNYIRRTLDSFGFSFEGSKDFAEYSRGNEALTLEYDPSDPDWFGWALGRYAGDFDVLYSGTDPISINSAEQVLEYVNQVFGYRQKDMNEVRKKSTPSAADRLKQNLKRAGYDMDERERYWRERVKKVNQDIEQWNADNPEHQIKKSTNESADIQVSHQYERDAKTGKVQYRGIQENTDLPGSQGDWVHGGFKVRFDPGTNTVSVFNRNQERTYRWPKTPSSQAYRIVVQQLIDKLEDESI